MTKKFEIKKMKKHIFFKNKKIKFFSLGLYAERPRSLQLSKENIQHFDPDPQPTKNTHCLI